MMNRTSDIIIRTACAKDALALREIYAPYVEKTAVSFEYEVPSTEEFQTRMENTLQKYPYLVAEKEGELLGYACTHAFVGRAAYDHCAETTIYLKENMKKMGIGKRLYLALEEISKVQNIYSLNACIGCPEAEDEYLTMNSIEFHTHMGYRFVGRFHKCGYKFGHWYDMVWMEKILKEHPETPPAVVPFSKLLEQ
ncbi:MAG: GNAT family N-acetyltransferase [Lachnospiraceae bacterium]|nr:GNAT family N-acetyltransferase [Lachnospiraceae bacterium]